MCFVILLLAKSLQHYVTSCQLDLGKFKVRFSRENLRHFG